VEYFDFFGSHCRPEIMLYRIIEKMLIDLDRRIPLPIRPQALASSSLRQ